MSKKEEKNTEKKTEKKVSAKKTTKTATAPKKSATKKVSAPKTTATKKTASKTTKTSTPKKKTSSTNKNKEESLLVTQAYNKTVKAKSPKVEPIKETKMKPYKPSKIENTLIIDGTEKENLREVIDKLEDKNILIKDKVIERSKARKIIVIILSILIAAIIIATTVYVTTEQRTKKINSQTVNSNIYEKVTNNKKDASDREVTASTYENIEVLSLSAFERKVLEGKDMIVLVASETCYGCIAFEPVIDEVFKEREDKIYEIDITQMPQEDINIFRTYYNFTHTPTIFYIKDGIVKVDRRGYMDKDALEEWLDLNIN